MPLHLTPGLPACVQFITPGTSFLLIPVAQFCSEEGPQSP